MDENVAVVDATKRRLGAIDRASKRVDATKRRWPSSTHFELGEEKGKEERKRRGSDFLRGRHPAVQPVS